jgi:bacterioferritin-associated ferredoxin
MNRTCDGTHCEGCPGRVVCRCLQVTEEAIVQAVTTFSLTTVQEIRKFTGAGDGCTCCHARLSQLLAQAQSPAICSVK